MSGPQGLEYPYVRFYFTYLKSLSTSISTVISARHFQRPRQPHALTAFITQGKHHQTDCITILLNQTQTPGKVEQHPKKHTHQTQAQKGCHFST